MTEENYDWLGWPLAENPFGKEFDLEARKRMVESCLRLNPFIQKYNTKLRSVVLEVGPFFDPLIIPPAFQNKEIFYLDFDPYVKKHLTEKFKNITFLFHNLNSDDENVWNSLEIDIKKNLKKKNLNKFHSIIASQVLNYIDYKKFLSLIKKYHSENGLIFINNAIDYGIPQLFSAKRPKSDDELIEFLRKIGYKIIEQKTITSNNKEAQKNNRLIIVGQK